MLLIVSSNIGGIDSRVSQWYLGRQGPECNHIRGDPEHFQHWLGRERTCQGHLIPCFALWYLEILNRFDGISRPLFLHMQCPVAPSLCPRDPILRLDLLDKSRTIPSQSTKSWAKATLPGTPNHGTEGSTAKSRMNSGDHPNCRNIVQSVVASAAHNLASSRFEPDYNLADFYGRNILHGCFWPRRLR